MCIDFSSIEPLRSKVQKAAEEGGGGCFHQNVGTDLPNHAVWYSSKYKS
jgi:hypothetical protein